VALGRGTNTGEFEIEESQKQICKEAPRYAQSGKKTITRKRSISDLVERL
jgi:hypothetical protein